MYEPQRSLPDSLQNGEEGLARLVTSSGSSQAFSILYERYHDLLYRYCRSILLHEADAHDAVQSTFTRALEALRRGQRDAPVRPWLFRIAHNESISMLRRRKATSALYSDLGPLSLAVEDRVGHREQVGLLLEDLQELPPRQRGAIVMRELGGLSHEDIAAALGISVSGARQAIFEARGALNEFAVGRAMACEDVRRELAEGDRRVMRRRPIRAHLRDCAACAAFATTIVGRRNGLRAVVVPIAVAPARLLVRLLGSGSTSVSNASGGSGGFFTAAFNNVSGAIAAAKPIAALAIGLTAAAGTGSVIYGLSNRTSPALTRTNPQTMQAPSPGPVAYIVRIPAAQQGHAQSGARARGAESTIGLLIADFGRTASGAVTSTLAGTTGHAPRAAMRSETRSGYAGSTAGRSSAPGPVSVQNASGSVGNGRSGQTGAGGGGSGASVPPVTGGGGNGNGDQAPGQAEGNGDGHQAPGQAKANGGANGNGHQPAVANGGNGNGGQPPGLTGGRGGVGNGGQPPGLTGGQGGVGNGGRPPGLTGGQGGVGNGGQPPGLTSTQPGNGNAGSKPHGG
jgi:RNA polymerase sigma factor (sigma-70 family)